MSARSLLGFFALAGAFFFLGARGTQAAVPTSTYPALVQIRVQNDQLATVGSGAGVFIDRDGRILTSYQAVKAWEQFKKQPILICPTIDAFTEPRCTMRAVVLKLNAAQDLALLQVRSMYLEENWMTVEERLLRQSYAFPFLSVHATATTERVELGDELALLGYPAVGGATLTYTKSAVTGFMRRAQKNGTMTPWLIKTESKFTSGTIGGGAFTANGEFIGMPTHASGTREALGHVISLPVISGFLKEVLGNDYLLGKLPLVLREPLIGTHSGLLSTTLCPDFSSLTPSKKQCQCRAGFFAIGNACLPGQVYCSLRFPRVSTYDGFLKQCLCPNAKGGTSACALPAAPAPVKPPPVPKPAPAPKKPTPPPTCPALATYNTSTKTCVCAKPYTLNAKKNACIFVGKPTAISQLTKCEVIGKYANKIAYPKGHSIIKQMTHVGKICFATIDEAKKANFTPTKTK